MHILAIGDVGALNGSRHVGDEAMLEALVERLSQRGEHTFTVLSANPEETAAAYGVKAVAPPQFSGPALDDDARMDRLETIVEAVSSASGSVPQDDPAWDVIGAVAGCDAVVIAGGGNLSSTWPEKIYERLCVSRLARAFSKPVFVTGQTIGPTLTGRDGELIAEILVNAEVVGVREEFSLDIARRLGVPESALRRTVDDATFLGSPSEEELTAWLPEGPYCLATFSPYPGPTDPALLARHVAKLLDHVAATTGTEVVLLPHEGASEGTTGSEPWGDPAMHLAIAEHLSSPHRLLPVLSNRLSAELARRATLSVSSRYHPAVFAISNGVPAITLSVDEYTDNKLVGTLEGFGQSDLAFPASSLPIGDVARGIDQLWAARGSLGDSSRALVARRRTENDQWWDELHGLITGASPAATTWTPAEQLAVLDDELRARVAELREWQRASSRVAAGNLIVSRALTVELAAANAQFASLELQAGQAAADRDDIARMLTAAESATAAAHELMSEIEKRITERRQLEVDALTAEVRRLQEDAEAIRRTKVYRWSRRPRTLYARIVR